MTAKTTTVLAMLVVCLVAVVGAIEMDEEMAELALMVRNHCVGETGVDITLVDKVNGGAELAPDPKLKCYIFCTMETAGMISNGEVDVDTVLSLLPSAMAAHNEPALRACGTQRGADDCDTAYQTQVCWQKANKADYFLI